VVIAACAVLLAACTSAATSSPSASPLPPPLITVPEKSLGKDTTMRLADGVTPPTNRWYSSLAFGTPGLPVFPKPLSFAPTEGGFTMGLTRPAATANTIMAPASAEVAVQISGASGYGIVSHADPVGVTLTMGDAAVTLAQGWPVVGVTADAELTLTFGVPFAQAGDGLAKATIGATDYGLAVSDGSIDGTADGTAVHLRKGGSAQLFAVPDGGELATFASALGEPVSGVTWGEKVTESSATTTLTYGEKTVLAMPHARVDRPGVDCTLGTYATIDGDYSVCAAGTLTWNVPTVTPTAALDLSRITAEQRSAIVAALSSDASHLPDLPSDSYFGGKALFRIANLLQIATALGEDATAADLRATLAAALQEWGDADRCAGGEARCFVYDPLMKGIVGVTPAFGSEDFNDHHFHYGYLLYAAAVAAEGDPELVTQIGPVFDQVAADIASADSTETFPAIRTFDPVEGHSWASGYSPFADGNNQESSSEAVSAWNAVALWAAVRGDAALGERATWMLSAEADAARRLWLEPDLSSFPEFDHGIVSLEWGAKRDYATWFSAEPSAMLGIQLIPMAPVAPQYLASVSPEQRAASIAEAAPQGLGVQFGDYLLMYGALGGADAGAAWNSALALPDSAIDDGDSRTYLLAWIASVT
jgi:endo-1,3(4)-beta-glucanase